MAVARRPGRRSWWLLGAVLVVLLVGGLVAGLRGSAASVGTPLPATDVHCADPDRACPTARVVGGPAAAPGAHPVAATAAHGGPLAGPAAGRTVRAMQMNLCDSGHARDCYTGGRAVTEAVGKIAAYRPDVVTLNEVCRADVLVTLLSAMHLAHPGGTVVAAFEAAWSPSRHGAFRCTNGDEFGDGVIVSAPAGGYAGSAVNGGTYPSSMQFAPDDEDRGWVCAALTGVLNACTSHLVANHPDLAARQCAELMGDAVPGFVAVHGAGRTIMGGDLNLTGAAAQGCVPVGYYTERDPNVVPFQRFIVTDDLAFRAVADLGMDRTTDHPALLLTLSLPGRPGTP